MDRELLKNNSLVLLGVFLVVFMTVVNLIISINAKNQREEIICILLIEPEERQTDPERVKACR